MNEKWKDYYYKGLAVFLTVAMCIPFCSFFAADYCSMSRKTHATVTLLYPYLYSLFDSCHKKIQYQAMSALQDFVVGHL